MAEENRMPERAEEEEKVQSGGDPRFAELEELQREIDRRLQDNRRFLEKFLDDDFADEDDADEDDGEELEEL